MQCHGGELSHGWVASQQAGQAGSSWQQACGYSQDAMLCSCLTSASSPLAARLASCSSSRSSTTGHRTG